MRRLSIIIGMVVALAITGAGVQAERADAALWPARCNAQTTQFGFGRCIDRHLNNLNRRVRAQGFRVSDLEFDAFVCEFVATEPGVFQWATDYGIDIGFGVVGYQCQVSGAARTAKLRAAKLRAVE